LGEEFPIAPMSANDSSYDALRRFQCDCLSGQCLSYLSNEELHKARLKYYYNMSKREQNNKLVDWCQMLPPGRKHTYRIMDKRICRTALLRLFHCSKNRWSRIKQIAAGQTSEPIVVPGYAKQECIVVFFLREMFKPIVEPDPSRTDRYWLPSYQTVKISYAEYVAWCGELNHAVVTMQYFRKVWANHFNQVHVRPQSENNCDTCIELRINIANAIKAGDHLAAARYLWQRKTTLLMRVKRERHINFVNNWHILMPIYCTSL